MHFIGRRRELADLERVWERDTAQLVLVYGRRRIGKSYLLQRFSERKETVFYQATQQAQAVELAAFSDLVRSLISLPAGISFPDWESALSALSRYAESRRLTVILDEFPNLCDATPGLASIIQRWWDTHGRRSQIRLILCGSAQTFMNELEAHSAPLFGRFTARLLIAPLSYRESAEFFPALIAEHKALVYGILGGTPMYLEQWDADCDIKSNLLRLYGDSLSSLIDAPDRMLATTLPDVKSSYRILQAIAYGKTRWSEIQDFAKVHDRAITQLVDSGLIERRVPITEDPLRSRRSTYKIVDPNLRFWFQYIARNRGRIERGLGVAVVKNDVIPFLDNHMGHVFEDMAREFSLDAVRQEFLAADDVGFWQTPDGTHEIDVVGAINRIPTFIGTVKWQKAPIDIRIQKNLESHAAALKVTDNVPRLFFGRNGIDERLAAEANVYGFSVDDLYAPIEKIGKKFR